MNRSRWIALGLLAVVSVGTLGVTLGYAWYLRSDGYRLACAATLSESLGLPSEIGRVVPRSLRSQEFHDVVVWLPERRDRAHTLERAVLTYLPTRAQPDAYEIDLLGGSSEVSTRTWLRSDYRGVIESGLRPGFAEGGPRRVTFSRMTLAFAREQFRILLSNATGNVTFESATRGHAYVSCTEINGFQSTEAIRLLAEFSEIADGVRLDRVELRVPDVPVRTVGLRELAGLNIQSGRFDGALIYRETDAGKELSVEGHCYDLDLAEATSTLRQDGWRGRCRMLELRELRIENRRPQRIRLRGTLADVAVDDVLATFGLPATESTLDFEIGDALLTPAGIERLVASGNCRDISLETLSRGLGHGEISGVLRITLHDLTIEHNRIKSMDATLRVADADGAPHSLETRLLRQIVATTLKFDLPPLPMDRLEYTKLGVRLQIHDEKLTVLGTHGDREKTILTGRVLGREIGLLGEPKDAIELSPWLDQARTELERVIRVALERAANGPAEAHGDGAASSRPVEIPTPPDATPTNGLIP